MNELGSRNRMDDAIEFAREIFHALAFSLALYAVSEVLSAIAEQF